MVNDDNKPPDSSTDKRAEHRLPDSQPASPEDLRLLSFQYMQDGFSIVNADGLHVDANPAFCTMTGFTREELIGFAPETCYWPPEERDTILAAFQASLTGDTAEYELIFMRKDGTRFPVNVVPFPIKDNRGRTDYYAATVKDNTERVKMELALRNSELRYHKLFDSAGDGIIIMDNDKVLDCNQRALELYDITLEQFINLPEFSLCPPTQSNGQISSDYYHDKVEAARSGSPQVFEWLGQKIDGTLIESEVTLTTFVLDEHLYTQSIVRDITARKKLERSLKASEVRFRELFESAGDSIVILRDNEIIDYNKRSLEIYGYPHDEVLSKSVFDFFPPAQPNGQSSREFYENKVESSRSGTPQLFEWTSLGSDGTLIQMDVTLTTFRIDEHEYTQLIARDVSERKKMEATLVELNKSLEDRVLQRTDELEKAYAELLQRNIHYQELAKRLTQAEEQERKRIAQLLHDNHQQLLVAARFRVEVLQRETDSPDAKKSKEQILEILDEAVKITRSLTMDLAPPILYGSGLVVAIQWLARRMEEEHQLKVDVRGSLPSTRIANELSDVLLRSTRELLFNVVKHAGVRHACVHIELADHQLSLIVEDEGAGFDLTHSLNPVGAYGLFSIQEQLGSLDGRLDISSTPGRGTVCAISIPMATTESSYLDALSSTDDISATPHNASVTLPRPIRILIADDHEAVRKALMQSLRLVKDFDVIGEAVDGQDAVEKTRTLVPDVVLMDVTMPRMTGVEATSSIMIEFPGVKIIGLSMHHNEEMESRMLDAGAANYLQKFTPVEKLFATIRAVMTNSSATPR